MRKHTVRRSWIAALLAAVLAVLTPGPAHAAPPSNDDFDNATIIAALPFQTTQSTAEATTAPDDPSHCYNRRSVWFAYTPSEDGIVQATVTVASGYAAALSTFTGVRGNLSPVPGACTNSSGVPVTFHVTAGTTYYFMTGSFYTYIDTFSIDVRFVPPSPNDDFANAQSVLGLPSTFSGDLDRAAAEPNEPLPSCDVTAVQSVWYVYSPSTTRWVGARLPVGGHNTITVYRGTALTELTELTCGTNRDVFKASVGETYYIRLGSPAASAGKFELHVENAPPLSPSISYYPEPGTIISPMTFSVSTGDWFYQPIVSGELRFGDGTSVSFSGGGSIRHQYTRDGVYLAEVTLTTDDGRTGTTTREVLVETHDISIDTFTVPARARAGQTKSITVTVANPHNDEEVRVQLYKPGPYGLLPIGMLTQWVPASNHTVEFPFAYTFSEADSTAGSITFTAIASIPNYPWRDDNGANNRKDATTVVS